MYYMKPLKSPTHIHLFDENFYGFETVFCIMVFGIFSMFYVRIMQSENSATNIHTHYRQSETAPIYTRIICEKNFAQIYMRIAVRLESVGRLIGRWCLCVRLYHVLYLRSSFG